MQRWSPHTRLTNTPKEFHTVKADECGDRQIDSHFEFECWLEELRFISKSLTELTKKKNPTVLCKTFSHEKFGPFCCITKWGVEEERSFLWEVKTSINSLKNLLSVSIHVMLHFLICSATSPCFVKTLIKITASKTLHRRDPELKVWRLVC